MLCSMKKIILTFITLCSLNGFSEISTMSNISEAQLKTCYVDAYVKILKEGLDIEDFMSEPDEKKQEKIIRKMAANLAANAGLLISDKAVHFQELKPFHLIRKSGATNSPFYSTATVEMISSVSKLSPTEIEQIFGSVMPFASALTNYFNDAVARGLLESIQSLPACTGVFSR